MARQHGDLGNRSARGVVFFTVEDETGLAHAAVMPDVYQQCGAAVYGAGLVVVSGRAERRGEGVSLLAEDVRPCL